MKTCEKQKKNETKNSVGVGDGWPVEFTRCRCLHVVVAKVVLLIFENKQKNLISSPFNKFQMSLLSFARHVFVCCFFFLFLDISFSYSVLSINAVSAMKRVLSSSMLCSTYIYGITITTTRRKKQFEFRSNAVFVCVRARETRRIT